MPDQSDHWQRMIDGLRSGNRTVVREFCNQYGPALNRIADRKLPDAVRRRIDAEDVVQSACRTFFRRARNGEFQLDDSDSLWRLLCAITLTKVREQARFHLRQRRGVNREQGALPAAADETQCELPIAEPGQTPAEAAEFADQFRALIDLLDPEAQRVVDLKIQDFTNEQIAEQLSCSERTVRRILKRVQSVLSEVFNREPDLR
jgi:RNA polymerase sigma-70 factor (ECF subfamily)